MMASKGEHLRNPTQTQKLNKGKVEAALESGIISNQRNVTMPQATVPAGKLPKAMGTKLN